MSNKKLIDPLKIKGDALKCWSILKPELIKRADFRCEKCGEKTEELQIHHKNGYGLDNRLENLEVLCPKCHRANTSRRADNELLPVGQLRMIEEVSPFPSGRPPKPLTKEYIRAEYDKAFPRA